MGDIIWRRIFRRWLGAPQDETLAVSDKVHHVPRAFTTFHVGATFIKSHLACHVPRWLAKFHLDAAAKRPAKNVAHPSPEQ